ncbi:MAG: CHC2 zinc finger domain-containing protein [Candidatus Marinimicrobia bacterium]|nr:CHC2 zinc finger domain-containing protein [Candidatus Neomarinimicrobiota bacterium]
MAKIPEYTIEKIKDSNDIVDLISSYLPLKKKGANYWARCPFHDEKTASFSVSPSKQIFHCFGCGVGGNAINFVMEYEKLSFIESVKLLAERANPRWIIRRLPRVRKATPESSGRYTYRPLRSITGNFFPGTGKRPWNT